MAIPYAEANRDKSSSIDGLWVLLAESQVPMMARVEDDSTYLLGFKNMSSARSFIQTSAVENAEPRMIVSANRSEYLRLAHEAGATGVLVDYNPQTQEYARAAELF